MLFTSGTSGEPKAAPRSYNSVHAVVAVIADVFRHGPQDTEQHDTYWIDEPSTCTRKTGPS